MIYAIKPSSKTFLPHLYHNEDVRKIVRVVVQPEKSFTERIAINFVYIQ